MCGNHPQLHLKAIFSGPKCKDNKTLLLSMSSTLILEQKCYSWEEGAKMEEAHPLFLRCALIKVLWSKSVETGSG